jgi:hypothetical protein
MKDKNRSGSLFYGYNRPIFQQQHPAVERTSQ